MKIAFYTLGCKVNQYETDLLISEFIKNGYILVNCDEVADVYVINSCTVTANGDKKTISIINRFKKLNNNAIVVLTGCFSQAFPNKAQKTKADIITGTKNKKNIINLINKYLLNQKKIIEIIPHLKEDKIEFEKIDNTNNKTRAFVKIQDGCNRYCAYCIIPYARGFSRSKRIDEIFDEVKELASNGYKEIVLVGINLSSYGVDINSNLLEAVNAVAKVEEIKRIRLGSLEPEYLSEDIIIALSKNKKFCPHFHISLQSGCDKTLNRMNRHYSTSEYEVIVNNIRRYFNNPSITTDVMVGFCGETDDEFNESCEFIKKVKFAQLHIFPYSKREGTKAFNFDNHLPQQIKKERLKKLNEIQKIISEEFLNNQVGKVHSVLFESTLTANGQEGNTENYTTVYVKSDINLRNKIFNVKITGINNNNCIGEIIE